MRHNEAMIVETQYENTVVWRHRDIRHNEAMIVETQCENRFVWRHCDM